MSKEISISSKEFSHIGYAEVKKILDFLKTDFLKTSFDEKIISKINEIAKTIEFILANIGSGKPNLEKIKKNLERQKLQTTITCDFVSEIEDILETQMKPFSEEEIKNLEKEITGLAELISISNDKKESASLVREKKAYKERLHIIKLLQRTIESIKNSREIYLNGGIKKVEERVEDSTSAVIEILSKEQIRSGEIEISVIFDEEEKLEEKPSNNDIEITVSPLDEEEFFIDLNEEIIAKPLEEEEDDEIIQDDILEGDEILKEDIILDYDDIEGEDNIDFRKNTNYELDLQTNEKYITSLYVNKKNKKELTDAERVLIDKLINGQKAEIRKQLPKLYKNTLNECIVHIFGNQDISSIFFSNMIKNMKIEDIRTFFIKGFFSSEDNYLVEESLSKILEEQNTLIALGNLDLIKSLILKMDPDFILEIQKGYNTKIDIFSKKIKRLLEKINMSFSQIEILTFADSIDIEDLKHIREDIEILLQEREQKIQEQKAKTNPLIEELERRISEKEKKETGRRKRNTGETERINTSSRQKITAEIIDNYSDDDFISYLRKVTQRINSGSLKIDIMEAIFIKLLSLVEKKDLGINIQTRVKNLKSKIEEITKSPLKDILQKEYDDFIKFIKDKNIVFGKEKGGDSLKGNPNKKQEIITRTNININLNEFIRNRGTLLSKAMFIFIEKGIEKELFMKLFFEEIEKQGEEIICDLFTEDENFFTKPIKYQFKMLSILEKDEENMYIFMKNLLDKEKGDINTVLINYLSSKSELDFKKEFDYKFTKK